jgi:hypothetical protein
MDADRFDALSRALSTGHTRRHLTRLVGGLSLGSVLSVLRAPAALAALRIGGDACTENRQCKTGQCVGRAGSKTCNCSQKYPKCKQPSNPCQRASCDFATGRCTTSNRRNGATCGTGKICQNGVCARTCTGSAQCGSECACAQPNSGGSTICVNTAGTGTSCMSSPCPAGSICINNIGNRDCFKPCGAS